ncbi:MAG: DUF1134 domain-containing protein [Pseudomonadota bacterium]
MKKAYQFAAGCLAVIGLVLSLAVHSGSASAEGREGFNRSSSALVKPRPAAYQPPSQGNPPSYTRDEILSAGHNFFGKTTSGFAEVVHHSFGYAGAPTAYIVGEEASGAFMGGLRYGEGVLHMKNGTKRKVYWQGPSLGFDVGGNGSRTMVLIYKMRSAEQLYDRFGGIEGSAYLVGGAGINFQRSKDLVLAPIRTGIGARLGANIGYLKYTRRPTWNPF